jgi:hypothetical protein
MTFVATYKQADLTLTGTMRKAQLAATATKTSRKQALSLPHTASPPPSLPDLTKRRNSEISLISSYPSSEGKVKACEKCRVRFSPFWWPWEGRVLCHKCHWSLTHEADVEGEASPLANGMSVGLVV